MRTCIRCKEEHSGRGYKYCAACVVLVRREFVRRNDERTRVKKYCVDCGVLVRRVRCPDCRKAHNQKYQAEYYKQHRGAANAITV